MKKNWIKIAMAIVFAIVAFVLATFAQPNIVTAQDQTQISNPPPIETIWAQKPSISSHDRYKNRIKQESHFVRFKEVVGCEIQDFFNSVYIVNGIFGLSYEDDKILDFSCMPIDAKNFTYLAKQTDTFDLDKIESFFALSYNKQKELEKQFSLSFPYQFDIDVNPPTN